MKLAVMASVFCLLFAGCATQPAPTTPRVTRVERPAPPAPPMPPGFKAAAPVKLAFAPASVPPPGPTNAYILPYNAVAYLVIFWQPANAALEMQSSGSITGPWDFTALYGSVPEGQQGYVAALVPREYYATHNLFTKSVLTPNAPISALAFSPEAQRESKQVVFVEGQRYRMFQTGPDGGQVANFQTFRLKK